MHTMFSFTYTFILYNIAIPQYILSAFAIASKAPTSVRLSNGSSPQSTHMFFNFENESKAEALISGLYGALGNTSHPYSRSVPASFAQNHDNTLVPGDAANLSSFQPGYNNVQHCQNTKYWIPVPLHVFGVQCAMKGGLLLCILIMYMQLNYCYIN